jgi:predicted Fe-Mo cluster-binding NifX family protein
MKIAVTSTGTDLESAVDPRFGRAAFWKGSVYPYR